MVTYSTPPKPCLGSKGCFRPIWHQYPFGQARPRKGGTRAHRTSVFPSVKWVGKAPNPRLPSSGRGPPHPRLPEHPTCCPPLLTTAGPRYCFDLSLLGRPGATSLMAAKTTTRGLLSAISGGLKVVLGPFLAWASQKSLPMSSQGSWQKTVGLSGLLIAILAD